MPNSTPFSRDPVASPSAARPSAHHADHDERSWPDRFGGGSTLDDEEADELEALLAAMDDAALYDDDWSETAGPPFGHNLMERGRSGAESALDFARQNPVGTALAVAGIALLFAPRLERDEVHAAYARTRDAGTDLARRGLHKARSKVARQEARYDRARDKLRGNLERMRERAEEGTEKMNADARRRIVAARLRTLDARERALDHADSLRDQARRQAERGVEGVREHPLIAGALAVALGAAVASALPRTRFEDSRLGAFSDRMMREAEEIYERERDMLEAAARGAWDEVRSMAKDTADTARRHVPDGEAVAEDAQARVQDGVARLAEGAKRGVEQTKTR